MRWFKHMSDSHNDEKISELLSVGGLEAYGFWWMLLEVIAGQMEKNGDKCSLSHTLTQWSRLLYSHHNKVSKHLGKLGVIGLVRVEYEESNGISKIRVTIPNLLKYRDEYSKKSGQNKDKLQPKKQKTDTDTDTETEKTTTTRAQGQLVAAISENHDKLKSLFPDINLPVATEKLLHHYRASPVLLDPYLTALNWFQKEFPQTGASNGHRHSASPKTVGAKKGFFKANPAGTDFLS